MELLRDAEYDQPKHSRDWDFEGSEEALAVECERDRKESGCIAHDYLWNGPGHYSIWRVWVTPERELADCERSDLSNVALSRPESL